MSGAGPELRPSAWLESSLGKHDKQLYTCFVERESVPGWLSSPCHSPPPAPQVCLLLEPRALAAAELLDLTHHKTQSNF